MFAANITQREMEVLQLLSAGLKGEEIAQRLYLSPDTIKSHRRSIMRKLDARNVAHLISKSFRKGILDINSDGWIG